jgi:hypothetical protein
MTNPVVGQRYGMWSMYVLHPLPNECATFNYTMCELSRVTEKQGTQAAIRLSS